MCDNKEQCVVTKNTLLPRVILTTSLRLLSLFSPSSSQLCSWLRLRHPLPPPPQLFLLISLCEVLPRACFSPITENLLEAFGFTALSVCHYFPLSLHIQLHQGFFKFRESPNKGYSRAPLVLKEVRELCVCVCM